MNATHPQIVIIGAGYAGMMTANRLAGRYPAAQITLVNAAEHFVERIRLHQASAGQNIRQVAIRELLNPKVNFVAGFVTNLHPDQHRLELQHNGVSDSLTYDYLVYALGSRIAEDTVPGIREHAFTLQTDAPERLRPALLKARRLVIIGGGLTGIEAATEFAEAYPDLQVTLATDGRLGAHLSQKGYAHLRQVFDRLNIKLLEGVRVNRIEAQQVVTGDGLLPFDVCLWAGAFTVPQLARQAGIKTSATGQVLVDAHLRSVSHPDIFAIGDSAMVMHRQPLRMACATAMPMGVHAADSLVALMQGKPLTEFRFGYIGQCISLGRHEGLIQLVDADDKALDRVITGRAGAFVKELICHFTVLAIRAERYFPGLYRYPQGKTSTPQAVIGVQHG